MFRGCVFHTIDQVIRRSGRLFVRFKYLSIDKNNNNKIISIAPFEVFYKNIHNQSTRRYSSFFVLRFITMSLPVAIMMLCFGRLYVCARSYTFCFPSFVIFVFEIGRLFRFAPKKLINNGTYGKKTQTNFITQIDKQKYGNKSNKMELKRLSVQQMQCTGWDVV